MEESSSGYGTWNRDPSGNGAYLFTADFSFCLGILVIVDSAVQGPVAGIVIVMVVIVVQTPESLTLYLTLATL